MTDSVLLTGSRQLRLFVRATTRRTTASLRSLRRAFDPRAVDAYWYTGERNFGDLLTPLLLRHYGLHPMYCRDRRQAAVVAVGSILQKLPVDYRGIVLGSGLISERFDLRFPDATILALRGELTMRCLALDHAVPLGDPGLLAPDLIRRTDCRKRFALGVVPHYMDKRSPVVLSLAERYRRDVLIIDVQRGPTAVIRDIARCDCVLSSSLHGVVVADALGIPNCWTILSGMVIGNGFKFRDYYSAFGIERDTLRIHDASLLRAIVNAAQPPPLQVAERQKVLRALFAGLAHGVIRT